MIHYFTLPRITDLFPLLKIPTCLLYDEYGQVMAWGLEAKNAGSMAGTTLCEWFKLYLEPKTLRDGAQLDPRLPIPPPGKRAIDLIVDFLSCLWEYAKDRITTEIGAVADLGQHIYVTQLLNASWTLHARLCGCLAHSTSCLGR